MRIFFSLLSLLFLVSNCSTQKSNKQLEAELVKLKNEAFCDCYFKATVKEPYEYKDGSTYFQIIFLKGEYILFNDKYHKMIDDWMKKEYNSKFPENNLYLMRCLDFYNSKELETFIDSVRQNEIRLFKKEGKPIKYDFDY